MEETTLILGSGEEIVCNEIEYFINMGGVIGKQPETYKELYINLIDEMKLEQIEEYIISIQNSLERIALKVVDYLDSGDTFTIPHYGAIDDEKIYLLKYRPDCVGKVVDTLERAISNIKFANKNKFHPAGKNVEMPTVNLKKLTEPFIRGTDIAFAKEQMAPIERYYVDIIKRLACMIKYINSL